MLIDKKLNLLITSLLFIIFQVTPIVAAQQSITFKVR